MPLVALVAVEKALPSFDKLFSYLIPQALEGSAAAGGRVLVPFGAGNKKRQGMIFALRRADETTDPLKPVSSLLDEGKPLLSAELLRLAVHIRNTVFCTYYEAVRLLIPAGLDTHVERVYVCRADMEPDAVDLTAEEQRIVDYLHKKRKPVGEKALLDAFGLTDARHLAALVEKGAVERQEALRRRVMDEKVVMVRLCPQQEPAKLTAKQSAVCALLDEVQTASLKEVCYFAAVTRAVVDALERKGIVEYDEREVYRAPRREMRPADPGRIRLTPEQQEAFDALLAAQRKGRYAVSLLYGVTGSGKTQVFLRLAQSVVQDGRGVLVLVPEISLTGQTIETFHACFGEGVAVIHSALSMGERLDEYKRIQRGEALVVVGTRSAVFAPVKRLGLIIIDEEQEPSYKSEKTPRYHARDIARWRAHECGAQLVLASATPSVESFYHAKKGDYQLVTLQGRYAGQTLPDVYILDMGANEPVAGSNLLSQRLCEELYHNLQAGEQSIVLLNRRGYHTLVKCAGCGEPAVCPNCSVSLTYHSANHALCCHYCGYMQPAVSACPHCGGKYERYQGAGTQRVEEELGKLYPQARILRMDMDTTMHKYAHERSFSAFAAHEYDIMVGTQMVAKGLNFQDVTLVGVLCTDNALYSDDFRSYERTFSLITQVVGRAGRSVKKGRAFIQTYTPDNPVIELASSQQYGRFFDSEIKSRKLGLYPPYCDICALGVTSEDERQAVEASQELLQVLTEVAKRSYPRLPLRVLGPSDFALYKMAGRYRRKLLLKCRNTSVLRKMLREVLAAYEKNKSHKKASVFVDMYYDSY